METQKIEKKLPEEILAVIDEVTINQSITRQEAISRLVTTVINRRNESENERLKIEIKELNRLIALKDDEIGYLRGELTALNRGLSKLAENLIKSNNDKSEVQSMIHPVREELASVSQEIIKIQENMGRKSGKTIEEYIPFTAIAILVALVVILLIVVKFS